MPTLGRDRNRNRNRNPRPCHWPSHFGRLLGFRHPFAIEGLITENDHIFFVLLHFVNLSPRHPSKEECFVFAHQINAPRGFSVGEGSVLGGYAHCYEPHRTIKTTQQPADTTPKRPPNVAPTAVGM